MSIRMGTSLSALSLAQLSPPKADAGKSNGPRVLSQEAIVKYQKQQALEQVNAGKRQSSDVDDFFLKFTQHRESKLSGNATQMAKIMNDSKDQHVITTNSDASQDEQKRIQKNFDTTMASLQSLSLQANNDIPLTDAVIEKAKDKYAESASPVGNDAKNNE